MSLPKFEPGFEIMFDPVQTPQGSSSSGSSGSSSSSSCSCFSSSSRHVGYQI